MEHTSSKLSSENTLQQLTNSFLNFSRVVLPEKPIKDSFTVTKDTNDEERLLTAISLVKMSRKFEPTRRYWSQTVLGKEVNII